MKKLKVELTKGLDGETVKTIGECNTWQEARDIIWYFKNDPMTIKNYKVERYDTIHRVKSNNADEDSYSLIDFGDYSYFIRVKHV